MKLLLLSPFFYPEPISTGKYNTELAKGLVAAGHEVEVASAHPIYPQWKVNPSTAQLPGVAATRGGLYLWFPRNPLLRRAVLELWYLWFVFVFLLGRRNRYDKIIAVFPPSLFMLAVRLLAHRVPVVGIVHDLQGVYAQREPSLIKRLVFGAIKRVEAFSFRRCESLIFLSQEMMDTSVAEYELDSAACYIHYPFVTTDATPIRDSLDAILSSNNKHIVYSGALGEKQAPDKLAQLLARLATDEVQVHIFSQGPEFERLKKQHAEIFFHPLVDQEDLQELLSRSSIQIIPQIEGSSGGSLPSKLPNLLAANCKILCISDDSSELARILGNYSKAAVSSTWDMSYLEALVDKLLQVHGPQTDEDKELLSKFKLSSLVARIGA